MQAHMLPIYIPQWAKKVFKILHQIGKYESFQNYLIRQKWMVFFFFFFEMVETFILFIEMAIFLNCTFSGFSPSCMVETVITHLCVCTVVLLFSWGVYLQNSAAITLIINIRLNEQFHRSLLKLVQVLYVLFLIWKNVCHSVEWLWKKGTYICVIFVHMRCDHWSCTIWI